MSDDCASNPNAPSTLRTAIPGSEPVELVAWYPEFAWYYPDCEPQTKAWAARNTRPDWVVIDCGAHIGYYAILFARLASAGAVYAFEPTATEAMLRRNLSHNRIRNVVVSGLALGDRAGNLEDSIYRIWGSEPERRVYTFTTIDAFTQERGLSRLDCIKIDVDSFDYDVLRGSEQTLARFNPWIIVELNHALSRRNQSDMQALRWLAERGYAEALVLDGENFVLHRDGPPHTRFEEIRLHFAPSSSPSDPPRS